MKSDECCNHPNVNCFRNDKVFELVITCYNCGNSLQGYCETESELRDRWKRHFYKRNNKIDISDLPMELVSR